MFVPCSLYLGSGHSPPTWEVNFCPQPNFKGLRGFQRHVTKLSPFLSISDPALLLPGSFASAVGLGLSRGAGLAGGWWPGWVRGRAGLTPLFTSRLWDLTMGDLDRIPEVWGAPGAAVERAQGLAKHFASMAAVQRRGRLPGGRTAAPSVPEHRPSSALGFRGIPDL